jgi:hypothetical protein
VNEKEKKQMLTNVVSRIPMFAGEAALKDAAAESAKQSDAYAKAGKDRPDGPAAYARLQILFGNCPRKVGNVWYLNTGPSGEVCGWTHYYAIPEHLIVRTDRLGWCPNGCEAWATWVR